MTAFQLFDALPAHIEDALRASIDRFGVLVPVTVDQNGMMLDGHHRARIADELGIPYDRLIRHCADDDERREIAHTLNADRRQLTDEQRRAVAAALFSQGHSERAVAGVVGVSPASAHRLKDELTASGEAVLPADVVGLDGRRQPARRPPLVFATPESHAKAQAALATLDVDSLPPTSMSAPEAARLAARQRVPDPVVEPVAAPAGKFSCLVIDPPWPMKKIERDERPDQGVELDYPTLDLWCQEPRDPQYYGDSHQPCHVIADWNEDDEYKPCQSIECVVGHVIDRSAAKDSHVYLWVTHKYLPAGLKLLEAWGFNYQCVMTWRKNVGITPFSWMYDTEHVLFGRCGDLPLNRMGLRLSFEAPVTGHSVKPDVFYERVIQASPGPRLDVFARRERDGFTVWGNEVSGA